MMAFRQVDARYPFLWEDGSQPAGRWHAAGEGPAHYFADTPDGAWAEFLRHEEITDPEDLLTIRRQMWVVEIGDEHATRIKLAPHILTGDRDTYPACRAAARALRGKGVGRITAPSAALARGGARPLRVADGVRVGEPRDGVVVVIFGSSAPLLGWVAATDARPPADLLDRVRYYGAAPDTGAGVGSRL